MRTGGAILSMPDASGTACTGAVYAPCTSNTLCTSMNCHLYQQSALQVCVQPIQPCTPGNNATCPMQNGVAATCNNMGICKPAAANSCTR